jgi:hypothetical protein
MKDNLIPFDPLQIIFTFSIFNYSSYNECKMKRSDERMSRIIKNPTFMDTPPGIKNSF